MRIDVNKIILARANQGLTIKELAEKSGLSSRTISRLEKNGLNGSSFTTIGKIANALGKKIEDFLVN